MASNDKPQSTSAEGPCTGCGETNHTAHNVSVCAGCLESVRRMMGLTPIYSARGVRWEQDTKPETATKNSADGITLKLTAFEASMLLCVVAVAKAGKSQFDEPDRPLRRRALEHVFKRLSGEMAVPVMADG